MGISSFGNGYAGNGIARDRGGDPTLAFLREGYAFGATRFGSYACDAFETRSMLQKAVCAMGEETARMFYAPGRFTRRHGARRRVFLPVLILCA